MIRARVANKRLLTPLTIVLSFVTSYTIPQKNVKSANSSTFVGELLTGMHIMDFLFHQT